MSPPGTTRLDSLTGLRWWAAFAVFAFHMANLAPLPIQSVLRLGNFGVAFFFILSGFVLTWSAKPTVTRTTFWWRRFARIWPAHMVALLLAIPVFYAFSPDPAQTWVKPVSVGILLLSVVLLQGWSRDPTILFSGNPAAWTLTCEAFFYALHPFVNRVLGKVGRRGALLAAGGVIAVALAYRIALLLWPASLLAQAPWPLLRLTEFVLGMAIAQAIRCGWRARLNPGWCYLIGGAAIGWITLAPRWVETSVFVRTALAFSNELVIVIFGLTLAAVACRDLRSGRSILRSRVLVALGDMSYAFYLVHATVLYAILSVVGRQAPGWSNLLWYAGVALAAIGVAALLHYLIERPVERRMRAWRDARHPPRAIAEAATPPVTASTAGLTPN